MDYKDYSILSDNEYLKLAQHYEETSYSKNDAINTIYNKVEQCKCMLYNPSFANYKIKNELESHLNTLTKLSNNLEIVFEIKKINNISFKEFNLHNYLLNLFSVQNLIIEYLENETKQNLKILLKNFKNEINNLITCLLNLLSTLNIKYFKFM